MRKRASLVVAGLVFAYQGGVAHAGGLLLQELSTTRNGVSQAGQAAYAYDAATSFLNPAGMARLKESEWMLGVQPLFTEIRFDPDESTTFDGGDGGEMGSFAPGLGAFYTRPLNDKWAAGFSVAGLAGGAFNPDDTWAGRFWMTDLSLVILGATPVVSYRINDKFSVGGGMTIAYGTMDFNLALPRLGNFVDQQKLAAATNKLEQAQTILDRFPGLGTPQLRNQVDTLLNVTSELTPGPDGEVQMETLSDVTYNFNVGVLYEHDERTRFGAIYRSKLDFELDGDVSFHNLPPLFEALGLSEGNVKVDVPLPQMMRASAYHQLTDTVAVMADVGWEDWSVMDFTPISGSAGASLEVVRDWQDTWHFGLGTEWRAAPAWLLQAGIAYDTSPVQARENNYPDMPSDRQWRYSAGFIYDWSENLKLGVAYTLIDFGRSPVAATNPFGRLAGDYDKFLAHVIALTATF